MQVTINESGKLVIEIDLNTKGATSKSGKSQVLASTEGFTLVSTPYGSAKLGLNLITTDAAWAGGKGSPVTVVRGPGVAAKAS
jgi:hypothetical protein